MAKKFEKWLDEFVGQGANPEDVTNWPEEAGGTTVVANPELSGDEDDLTGLEVDGVKYKIPEAKVYSAGNGIAISEEGIISLDIAVADQEAF